MKMLDFNLSGLCWGIQTVNDDFNWLIIICSYIYNCGCNVFFNEILKNDQIDGNRWV